MSFYRFSIEFTWLESIRTNHSREPATHTAVFLLRCVEHSKEHLAPSVFKSRGLCRNMD
jgi:hypothetical protein